MNSTGSYTYSPLVVHINGASPLLKDAKKMIENRFLHFLTQEAFNRKRSEIPNNSIVFIDKGAFDKPEIWTHGKCYSNTEDIYDLESIATKVVANPSDAASVVLNKIKIANTVYSIGSGQSPVT